MSLAPRGSILAPTFVALPSMSLIPSAPFDAVGVADSSFVSSLICGLFKTAAHIYPCRLCLLKSARSLLPSGRRSIQSGMWRCLPGGPLRSHGQSAVGRRCVLRFTLLVSEEAAPADDISNLRWHHLVPAFVPGSDTLEHVP